MQGSSPGLLRAKDATCNRMTIVVYLQHGHIKGLVRSTCMSTISPPHSPLPSLGQPVGAWWGGHTSLTGLLQGPRLLHPHKSAHVHGSRHNPCSHTDGVLCYAVLCCVVLILIVCCSVLNLMLCCAVCCCQVGLHLNLQKLVGGAHEDDEDLMDEQVCVYMCVHVCLCVCIRMCVHVHNVCMCAMGVFESVCMCTQVYSVCNGMLDRGMDVQCSMGVSMSKGNGMYVCIECGILHDYMSRLHNVLCKATMEHVGLPAMLP